jgi:hypothetical protein
MLTKSLTNNESNYHKITKRISGLNILKPHLSLMVPEQDQDEPGVKRIGLLRYVIA